jgi:alkanesulfonate monooxygenase SsuD/methylene tetrahydromethanopterin reductase-like flavin-dependent oxidoreductase (luciferase family)
MKYALNLPNYGAFGDARVLARLAREAEDVGWDGFFLWDHIAWMTDVVDPWIALAAIALNTERLRIGTIVTPIPRRRPWKLARETVSIDHLSGGRLVLGVGIGVGEWEWNNLGEETDPRRRGAMLDEGLDVLTRLWSGQEFTYEGTYYRVKETAFLPRPVQQPRIPIWAAGNWPNQAPMRRGARWDGICPQGSGQKWDEMMSVEALKEAIDYARSHRADPTAPFDVVHSGIMPTNPAKAAAIVAPYAEIGVTWWSEIISPWVYGWNWEGAWPVEAMHQRILAGPPKG